MRRVLASLTLFFATSILSAQTKEETVVYPRGSTATGATAQASSGGASNASTLLAVALLAGAAGWWLWLKRRGGNARLAGKKGLLNIEETRSLGSRQYLVVADYDGRKFLLGVCPGSIEMLAPLDGSKTPEES